jgi:hypothetical protein
VRLDVEEHTHGRRANRHAWGVSQVRVRCPTTPITLQTALVGIASFRAVTTSTTSTSTTSTSTGTGTGTGTGTDTRARDEKQDLAPGLVHEEAGDGRDAHLSCVRVGQECSRMLL